MGKKKKTAPAEKQSSSEKELAYLRGISESQALKLFRQSHKSDTDE